MRFYRHSSGVSVRPQTADINVSHYTKVYTSRLFPQPDSPEGYNLSIGIRFFYVMLHRLIHTIQMLETLSLCFHSALPGTRCTFVGIYQALHHGNPVSEASFCIIAAIVWPATTVPARMWDGRSRPDYIAAGTVKLG